MDPADPADDIRSIDEDAEPSRPSHERWRMLADLDTASADTTRRPTPRWDSNELASILASLRQISLTVVCNGASEGNDLQCQQVLGEGGMGVVTLCHQRSLERDVAVKTVRGPSSSPRLIQALLHEARVTGALEHPGIVPIYELGISPEGQPVLVMKRVVGVVWRDLLCNPSHPAWRVVQGDPLLFHIDVLQRVCDVVHFAHTRGIVHRDLKTANVMIDDSGEVFVLDWGIACEIGCQENPDEIIGTPNFMAPEMLSNGTRPITPQTDVYLLGGMLHEVLTGEPRHQGTTLIQVLYNANQSEPVVYPPSVPAELAAVCNWATSAAESDRPADVRVFSAALTAFTQQFASE